MVALAWTTGFKWLNTEISSGAQKQINKKEHTYGPQEASKTPERDKETGTK